MPSSLHLLLLLHFSSPPVTSSITCEANRQAIRHCYASMHHALYKCHVAGYMPILACMPPIRLCT
jgi:hypothetical protein